MLQLLQTNLSTTTLTPIPKRRKTRDRPEEHTQNHKKKKKIIKAKEELFEHESNQNMKTSLLECSDAKRSKKKTYGNNELAQTVFACKRFEWAAMYYYC